MANQNAFPESCQGLDPRAPGWIGGGMTLRDYFAAKAMQAILDNPEWGGARKETVASYAYAQADAMLAARENES